MERIEQPGEGQYHQGEALLDGGGLVTGEDPVTVGEVISAPMAGTTLSVRSRPVDRSADLIPARLKPRWLEVCFAVTFITYVVLIPHFLRFNNPPTGDQPFYLMITSSIVQDGDLELTNNYDNKEYDKFYSLAPKPPDFVGMPAPYPLTMHLAFSTARPAGERYGFHMPGLPALLVPAWITGGWFSLWWPMTIVFMCLVGALVATNVFLLAHELTGRTWIAAVVWLTVSFSNPVMTYSYLIFTELTTGLLVIYAFRRLALGWRANGPWRLLLVGSCIAYIPWLAWRCVPIAAALAMYAAVQWWRSRPSADDGAHTPSSIVHRPSSVLVHSLSSGAVLVPIAVSAALLAGYNLFLFGSIVQPAKINELGDAYPFHWPWAGVQQLSAFFNTAFGLLFDQSFGLLPYTPVYLLAAVGIIAMLRSPREADRRLLLGMALVAVPYLMTIASYEYWHGAWCPPARFLTTFAPLLGGLLAVSLLACGSWLYKLIYGLLALAGVAVQGMMMYDARNMWPFDPANTYRWLEEVSPISLNIRGLLNDYLAPNETQHPLTTAQTIGLALAIILFCYLLMVVWPGPWRARRLSLPVHSLAWLGCIAAVGLSWGAMNYPFLKPRTTLTLLERWGISKPLYQPYGIAFYNGKIYIASYGQTLPGGGFQLGEFGEFDTATGYYKIVQPRALQGLATILHPSEVKVGPDGLLYLLNNGGGKQAMFVLNSNMDVVRQLELDAKSTVSIGLSFGPDGKMYVADLVGGHILRYDAMGGDPLNSWGGMNSNYNNVAGVTVAPDGMIYSFEGSYQRIQQFDPTGRFVRVYDVGCPAMFGAIDGDWMDVTCQNGFRSVNLKEHYTQLPVYVSGNPKLTGDVPKLYSPTGLAYAPDHTLYVLDANTLYHYKVQH